MAMIVTTTVPIKDGCVLLRTPTAEDWEHVLAVSRSVIEENLFTITEPDEFLISEQDERNWIDEHYQHERKLLVVAEIGSELIGLINFACNDRRRLSHWGTLGITVHRDFRDRGVGRALTDAVIDWACGVEGVEKITLEVAADNERAMHLYQKLGFEVEGKLVRGIKRGPNDYVDQLIMSRGTSKGR